MGANSDFGVDFIKMKQWTREQIMKGLKELVTEINFLKFSEDYNGKKGGIWTSGESDWIFKGLPPFDHSVEYGNCPRSYIGYPVTKHLEMKVKGMYVCGIHREIYSWLEERGWYPKWEDGGTLFFWKNSNKHVDTLKDIQNHPDSDENSVAEEILRKLNEKFQNE